MSSSRSRSGGLNDYALRAQQASMYLVFWSISLATHFLQCEIETIILYKLQYL